MFIEHNILPYSKYTRLFFSLILSRRPKNFENNLKIYMTVPENQRVIQHHREELKSININYRKTDFRSAWVSSNNLIEVYKKCNKQPHKKNDVPISIGIKRTIRNLQVKGILGQVEAGLIYLSRFTNLQFNNSIKYCAEL